LALHSHGLKAYPYSRTCWEVVAVAVAKKHFGIDTFDQVSVSSSKLPSPQVVDEANDKDLGPTYMHRYDGLVVAVERLTWRSMS
jgi:hypothetical protein